MIKLKSLLPESKKQQPLEEGMPDAVAVALIKLTILALPFLSIGALYLNSKLNNLILKAVKTFSPKVRDQIEKAEKIIARTGDKRDVAPYLEIMKHLKEKGLANDQELIRLLNILVEHPYTEYPETRREVESAKIRNKANKQIAAHIKSKYPELAAAIEERGAGMGKFATDILNYK